MLYVKNNDADAKIDKVKQQVMNEGYIHGSREQAFKPSVKNNLTASDHKRHQSFRRHAKEAWARSGADNMRNSIISGGSHSASRAVNKSFRSDNGGPYVTSRSQSNIGIMTTEQRREAKEME